MSRISNSWFYPARPADTHSYITLCYESSNRDCWPSLPDITPYIRGDFKKYAWLWEFLFWKTRKTLHHFLTIMIIVVIINDCPGNVSTMMTLLWYNYTCSHKSYCLLYTQLLHWCSNFTRNWKLCSFSANKSRLAHLCNTPQWVRDWVIFTL